MISQLFFKSIPLIGSEKVKISYILINWLKSVLPHQQNLWSF